MAAPSSVATSSSMAAPVRPPLSPIRPKRRSAPASTDADNSLPKPAGPPPTSLPVPGAARGTRTHHKALSIDTARPRVSAPSDASASASRSVPRRPLPHVPASAGPASAGASASSASASASAFRPLPLPPTPATASSTTSFANASTDALAPSLPRDALPPRKDSLSPTFLPSPPAKGPRHGHIAPLVLVPEDQVDGRLLTVPPSPLFIAAPPSPTTRRQRNASKLARHLGQSVCLELPQLGPPPPTSPLSPAGVLVFRRDSDDSDSDGDDELLGLPDRRRAASPLLGAPVPSPARRKHESRHWWREEKGRMVEQSYAEVQARLRSL